MPQAIPGWISAPLRWGGGPSLGGLRQRLRRAQQVAFFAGAPRRLGVGVGGKIERALIGNRPTTWVASGN